jgi:hypothetical protein
LKTDGDPGWSVTTEDKQQLRFPHRSFGTHWNHLLILGVSLTFGVLALSAPAHAGKTVKLGCSDGGNVAHHVMIARDFLQHRHRLVITCNRASAAAIQVIWYRKHGGKVCAKPGVRLFLHMGYDPEKRIAVDVNRQYLGRSYREGWYHPSKFKIGEC